jgi:tRNA modification GTPase
VDELGQEAMIRDGRSSTCSFAILSETALAHDRALNIINSIRSHLDDNRRGEILRSGIKLAIFGPPNAGKSSLFNFLGMSCKLRYLRPSFEPLLVAQRDAAITSPIPGTTRDVLTLTLDIGGFPVVLSDTAGLRETLDTVEQVGVGRAGNAYVQVIMCYISFLTICSGSKRLICLFVFYPFLMFYLLRKMP